MKLNKQDWLPWLWINAGLFLLYGLIYQLNVAFIIHLWAWLIFSLTFVLQLIIAYSLEPVRGKWLYYIGNFLKLIALVWMPQFQMLFMIVGISLMVLVIDYTMVKVYSMRPVMIPLNQPLKHYPFFVEQQKILIPHILATLTLRHNLISFIGFSMIALLMVYGSELYTIKDKYIMALVLLIASGINYMIFIGVGSQWKESGMICLVYVILGFILIQIKSNEVVHVKTKTKLS